MQTRKQRMAVLRQTVTDRTEASYAMAKHGPGGDDPNPEKAMQAAAKNNAAIALAAKVRDR